MVTKKKIKFEYTKVDEAVFIGHLDMQILFIRALNRAGIRCAYSKGFHPMPKMSFGSALSLGLNSISEYAEFELTNFISADEFMKSMNENLPNGLKILNASEISFKQEALFKSITKVIYEAKLDSIESMMDGSKTVRECLDDYHNSGELIITKTKKNKVKRTNVKDFVDTIQLDDEKRTLTVTIRRTDKGELNIFNFLSILLNIAKDDIIGAEILKTKSIISR